MHDTTRPRAKSIQIQITANALIKESWEALERSDIAFAKQFGQDALDLSRSIEPSYDAGCAHSLIILAEAARNEGQYGTAVAYCVEAELIYENLPVDIWFARALYIMGYSHEHLGTETEALRNFHALLDVAHELENHTFKAMALRRIGVLHFKRNQADVALEYYDQCLELYEVTEDKTGIGGVYVDMSDAYFAQGKHNKALEWAERSLKRHIEKGLMAPTAMSHNALARIYLATGDKQRADFHITESFKFAQKSDRLHPQLEALKTISSLRREMGQTLAALKHLQEALELATRADDLFEASECHRLLAETYAALNEYDAAYQHHQEFHQIRENLWNESNKTRFESLEILYKTRQAQTEANLQRELREQDQYYYEKLSAIKDDIISHTSHDLKNPLASLLLTAQILERHGRSDDEKGKELIQRIYKIIEQMRELITNVLDLARLETGKALETETQDYVSFVRQTLEEQQHYHNAEAKQITLNFNSEIEKQDLHFDTKPMEQVINNLVSNAIKYTPTLGQVSLSISKDDNWIVTSIRDTGIGIPSDDLPNIFERFYRVDSEEHRSIEGTGLGLAICKSIIDQHNGTITVESVEGEGSTFYFSLPIEISN